MLRRTLVLVGISAACAAAQTVQVRTDPRAEILAIMFRLAGAPEYSQGRVQPYIRQIDSAFTPFKDHAAIQEINRLRSLYSVSFDAVMSMAANITDPIVFGERVPFDSPASSLDRRWHGAEARPFLAAARDFARDSHVAAFLLMEQPTYDSAAVRMRRLINTRAHMEWFNAFFGERAGGVFIASPLLANAGGNFGPHFDDAATHEMYAYLGVGDADPLGFPRINDGILPTVIHEFSHSFVNHVVESRHVELQPSGERIFATVQAAMRSQAYGSWQTMLDESVVRASVIRYLLAKEGPAAAEAETRAQRGLGFVWMDDLVSLLGDYESSRPSYPTLSAFMPRIIAFYDELAPRIDRVVGEFDAHKPTITESSIPDGAADVDPSVDTITVRFDRPMGSGYSINGADGADCPTVTASDFDAAHTTFTLHIKLEPNHAYGLHFTGAGFASADGYPLKDFTVRFHT
jgi:hypothetical protein